MELVGRIDYVYNIKINPLNLDFSKFTTPYCDVCHTSHKRNITYIVQQDDGTLIQVGRDCLTRLFGYIPTHCDSSSDVMRDSLVFGYSPNRKSFNTRDFLYALIEYLEKYGFSKKLSYDDITNNKEFIKYLDETERDYTKVNKMIDWYKDLYTSNSFTENVRTLVIEEWFPLRYFNIIKYAYKIYMETINYKADYDSKQVDYTETVIEQVDLIDTRESSYGYRNFVTELVYRIIDVQGNVFQYKTSRENLELKAGDKIKFKYKERFVGETAYRATYDSRKYGTVNIIKNVKVIK